ncbi:MAG: T9SS type A sorting domain-containing protein [Bacteroidetes bacterium]|nr:T9SS type A sorting domain-containing protein [Bacteroidota bacterium]
MTKHISALLALLTFFSISKGQIINTIAGNGTAGYGGDNGVATSAVINAPSTVAVDGTGRVYIVDKENSRIRMINTSGIITTIAGTGVAGYNGDNIPAIYAQLNTPWGIALDSFGNIYVGDRFNYRIRKIDTLGIISTIAGTGNPSNNGDGGLATNADVGVPISICFDATGNLYFTTDAYVRKVAVNGIISTYVKDSLDMPGGLIFDASGNLYIADGRVNRVWVVSPSGVISTFAGTGVGTFGGDGGQAVAAQLRNPGDVAVDAAGDILIADIANHRIRKVDHAGIITTFAGTGTPGFSGDGGYPLSAQLQYPTAVFCSPDAIYITDCENNRIRKIDATAKVQTGETTAGLVLYPNPNIGNFCIRGKVKTRSNSADLVIMDLTGKVLLRDKVALENGNIQREVAFEQNVPAGCYVLQVVTEQGTESLSFEKR